MKLTQSQIDQINVTVDSYNYVIENEHIVCSCLIADNDTEDRIVTKKEVSDYVHVYNGKVWVTDNSDTQEGYYEIFESWFDTSITTVEFESDLADIINKRENRKHLYKVVDMPTATDILNAIKDCK